MSTCDITDDLWCHVHHHRVALCSWGVGYDPASGCENVAELESDLCAEHQAVATHLEALERCNARMSVDGAPVSCRQPGGHDGPHGGGLITWH
jgi:hypothetical protein